MTIFYKVRLYFVSSAFTCLALPGVILAGREPPSFAGESVQPSQETEQETRAEVEKFDELEDWLREDDDKRSEQLVTEYIVVGFETNADFEHAGNCSLLGSPVDEVRPWDIAVIVEGKCQGRVGETMSISLGIFEVSVDVVDAETQVVEIQDTTAQQPMIVTVPIRSKNPRSPTIVE